MTERTFLFLGEVGVGKTTLIQKLIEICIINYEYEHITISNDIVGNGANHGTVIAVADELKFNNTLYRFISTRGISNGDINSNSIDIYTDIGRILRVFDVHTLSVVIVGSILVRRETPNVRDTIKLLKLLLPLNVDIIDMAMDTCVVLTHDIPDQYRPEDIPEHGIVTAVAIALENNQCDRFLTNVSPNGNHTGAEIFLEEFILTRQGLNVLNVHMLNNVIQNQTETIETLINNCTVIIDQYNDLKQEMVELTNRRFVDSEERINQLQVIVNETVPIGSIIGFSGNNIPNGFLLCDGSNISRNIYLELFNIIGVTYGIGDAVTTFGLPDYRGRVLIGTGHGQGLTNRQLAQRGGFETHTLTVNEMPSHDHPYNHELWLGGQGLSAGGGHGQVGFNQNHDTTAQTGGNIPHNNMQPYIVINYIIKF